MEDQVLKNISKKIKKLRKDKGYTSYESFVFDYDLPRMQYWRIESGKTNLTIKSLLKILKIHKLTLKEFFSSDID